MKRFGQILIAILVVFCGSVLLAHSGRTDSRGGHNDRKNGGYHYHNSGRSSSPGPSYKSAPSYSASSKPSYKPTPSKTVVSATKLITITENHWQVALNKKFFKGKLEAPVSSGRVDILTDKFAVEVDKVSKYKEGCKQVLKYAKASGKKPVLALYIDGERDGYELLLKAGKLCNKTGVTLLLVNCYVSVNDLVSLTPNSTIASSTSSVAGKEFNYWLNSSSSVRHNSGCRYYLNTSNGRKCSRSEGRACGICGG